jgi:hypothetical protein
LRADALALPGFQVCGLALGIPTAKPPDPLDDALPLDRLIRAMAGSHWAALVLAMPVSEQELSDLRNGVISEIRDVEDRVKSGTVAKALGEYYSEQLKITLHALTAGIATGGWRTGVHLLGDAASYQRLTSVWRSTFSGEQSLPEPIRVYHGVVSPDIARTWGLPDSAGAPGPGKVRQPYQYQTLLTSTQLAAYIHLPQMETTGFSVDVLPDFDAEPPVIAAENAISLGMVVLRGRPTQRMYQVSSKGLTRHAFITGVTGAGKSNTIFHLLKQARVPFLVIEPAKAEYRSLLNEPALKGKGMRIYTLGDELTSPFRLNPFEVLSGTRVSEHLDLLRAVFAASFGMWTPLPQVLEQCLNQIYEDRGWDISADVNRRLDQGTLSVDAFPTLTDLANKVRDLVGTLGYGEEVTGNIRAALETRVNGLRAGGKGRMLDVQRSLPIESLLAAPTVLELEYLGDDDDKAFVMGLLLIRLAEHRRAGGESSDLRHLLIIEEAHRLLANVAPKTSEEQANARGKAVETFANLLSEVRAYGQGIIVADQVPVKLAPDVIKNTTLKIVHRMVAADDRTMLAGAMAMSERQSRSLATLVRGSTTSQAVVFSEGDDTPLLVEVPKAKDEVQSAPPSQTAVAQYMTQFRAPPEMRMLFLPSVGCSDACMDSDYACQAARRLVADSGFQRTFARVVLSTIENPRALDRMWPDLISEVRAKRPATIDESALLRCLVAHASYWYVSRRGTQAGWTYSKTQELADLLHQVLKEQVERPGVDGSRARFQRVALDLHGRTYNPYPACAEVCTQPGPLCLYRYAAADKVPSSRNSGIWRVNIAALERTENESSVLWKQCQDAAFELVEWPEGDVPPQELEGVRQAAVRTALCFAQQMLASDSETTPRVKLRYLATLLEEANR